MYPTSRPRAQVCLLGCGISTGWGAVYNTAKVPEGSTAAVFGIGAVGLAVIEALVAAKASRIIAVDTNPEKEEVARSWGATDFLNPKARLLPTLSTCFACMPRSCQRAARAAGPEVSG